MSSSGASKSPLGDFNGGAGLPLTVGTHAFLVYIPPPNNILYNIGMSEGEVYAEDTALQILEGLGVGDPGFGGAPCAAGAHTWRMINEPTPEHSVASPTVPLPCPLPDAHKSESTKT